MSDHVNTGGPAFPSGLIDPSTPEDAVQSLHNGMTLRDYFAAKAMQAIIARADDRFTTTVDFVGGKSYQYADAMLRARQK